MIINSNIHFILRGPLSFDDMTIVKRSGLIFNNFVSNNRAEVWRLVGVLYRNQISHSSQTTLMIQHEL